MRNRLFISLIFCLLFIPQFLNARPDFSASKAAVQEEAVQKELLRRQMQQAEYAATPNQLLFDVTGYNLDLNLDVPGKTITGQVTFTFTVTAERLSEIQLNLVNGMVVSAVMADSQNLVFVHANNLLTVTLSRAFLSSESVAVTVAYHGKPQATGLGAFVFSQYMGKPWIWSLSEPFGSREWWPCKDIPSDKADSVDIKITVPKELVVASNGRQKSVTETEFTRTFWWHESYPIATYLVSVAIHPYQTYQDWYVTTSGDSMPIDFFVLPGHWGSVQNTYSLTKHMISAFAGLFGEYPFLDEKYGHAEFGWGGGMEHQTITSLGGSGEGLIVHELAHQWWGDMVTCDSFQHIWLNEGFATYAEALWWEHRYGAPYLHLDMKQKAYLGPGTVFVENPETESVFDYGLSYAKAAWVLHMLRHVIGDDVFFEFLHTYYAEFKYKTATTEQFRVLCERVSGQNLKPFFQQWIYEEGYPQYRFLWENQSTENGQNRLFCRIEQEQPFQTLFEMPLDLRVKTAAGDTLLVLNNTARVDTFSLTLPSPIIDVQLDPENWVLSRIISVTKPKFTLGPFQLNTLSGMPRERALPGDTLNVQVMLNNSGITAESVILHLFAPAGGADIRIANSAVGSVPYGGTAENSGQPFQIFINPDMSADYLRLTLTLTATGGFTQNFPIKIPVGFPAILLVDDDAGEDYERYYQSMFFAMDQQEHTWSITESGVPTIDFLREFDAVVWFTGDDDTTAIDSAEQVLISEYLASNGRLLLSGQNIGRDLVTNGVAHDIEFYQQVLKSKLVSDSVSGVGLVGIPGDPIGNGLSGRFNENVIPNAQNQLRPDGIQAADAAANVCFMYWPSTTTAGIYWQGAENNRLIYLAFGLEGIGGPTPESQWELLEACLNWLRHEFTGIQTSSEIKPMEFSIQSNFPNPFNPATRIQFSQPEAAVIKARIFNSLGQQVRILYDGVLPAGVHILNWDGNDDSGKQAASGIYYLQLRRNVSGKQDSRRLKMLKMK